MADKRKWLGSSRSYSLSSLPVAAPTINDNSEVSSQELKKESKKPSARWKLTHKSIKEEDENQNHMTSATSSFQSGSEQVIRTDKSIFNIPLDHSFKERFSVRRTMSAGFLPSSSEESLEADTAEEEEEEDEEEHESESSRSKHSSSSNINVSAAPSRGSHQTLGRSWSLFSVVRPGIPFVGSIKREKHRQRSKAVEQTNAELIVAGNLESERLDVLQTVEEQVTSGVAELDGVSKIRIDAGGKNKEEEETLGFEEINMNNLRGNRSFGRAKTGTSSTGSLPFSFNSLRKKSLVKSSRKSIFAYSDDFSTEKPVKVGVDGGQSNGVRLGQVNGVKQVVPAVQKQQLVDIGYATLGSCRPSRQLQQFTRIYKSGAVLTTLKKPPGIDTIAEERLNHGPNNGNTDANQSNLNVSETSQRIKTEQFYDEIQVREKQLTKSSLIEIMEEHAILPTFSSEGASGGSSEGASDDSKIEIRNGKENTLPDPGQSYRVANDRTERLGRQKEPLYNRQLVSDLKKSLVDRNKAGVNFRQEERPALPKKRTVTIDSTSDEDQDNWSTSDGSFIMERTNSISSVNSASRMEGGDASDIVDGVGVLNALIKVRVGTVDLQKRMCFPIHQKIWEAKLQVLSSFPNDVQEGLNYGFFILPANNRAGKFLDDERSFKEYNIDTKAGLEFKFKKRVYRQMSIDFAQVRKNHSKSNLRSLLDAIKSKDASKVEKLLSDKLIDPNFVAESIGGETPLTFAATLDKTEEIVKLLVANGAHLDFRNKHGQTAVHKAVEKGIAKNTELLLDLGASPNYRDAKGLTPVHYSVIHGGDPACLSILVKDRSELDVPDDKGWRELHQACRHGRIQHIETLLSYDADMDAQNEAGNTPLHVCASYNQTAAARILLFRGASKTITNQASQTAYQVAIVSNNMDLAENIKNFSEDQVDSAGSGGYHSPMGHRKVETTPPNNEYVALQNYHAEGIGELSITKGDVVDDPGMKNGKGTATLKLADTHGAFFEPRVAVLSRGKKGFGFVLRGAKSPKNPSVEFVPTKEFPALQYLESVDRGSPADKAGLLRGDFLLELNGEDVTSAPHQQVVHMVVTAPDTIVMKVVTAPNIRGQEALEKLAAKHPKKLSRFQQRTVSSFESDTWSVCSSLGEMDDRDTLIRPEVEIISIVSSSSDGTEEHGSRIGSNRPISSFFEDELFDQIGAQCQGPSTPVMPHNAGATPTGQPQPDDPRNWQSTLPSNGIRSKPQRPTMPPPAPNKFNTVARMTSGQGDNLRHQAIQGASHDRSTAFEVDLADGGISDGVRRYSAGSDSAVSSSRSSPASSYSNTASSTTSGTDSAVNMLYDRTASDSGATKSHAKKPLPPPPMRSSSLPTDSQSSDGSSQGERVDSPTEPPKTGFAALIAKAAADKNRKSSAGPGEMQASQPASSAGPDHRRSSDMTAFEIAMKAKTKSLRRQSSGDVSPGKSPKPIPEVTDGSSDLMAAIARRKAKVESQHSGSDIESKIKNFKSQEGQDRVMDNAPLASALAKRRSTMEQVSSDESSESPHGSPKRQPAPPPVKQPSIEDKTSKPSHRPPLPPVKVKEKPPPPRPRTALKPQPPAKAGKPSHVSSKADNEPSRVETSDTAISSGGVVLAPPALYNDRSLERTQRPSRDHLSETGSVSSSQSSLSTVSNMSTDPSSSNDSSESTDRLDTMDSTNSLKSSSSTSSSVVTVKSNSDPEIISEGNSPDVNGKSDSSRGIPSKPAAEWTASEVSEWLSSINMADYINDFVDNEITGEHLMSLTKEDLMELGVKPLGHKKAIMKAIEKLS
ncbi:uncharacterized protein [Apostichopus japonicus]|uniref:uncharacterized protein isoform X4 n=1 Tax=Stichopus japonicus TaxID=307972 RepID=UPI003AB745A6